MGILHVANELRLLRCTFLASQESFAQQGTESDGNQGEKLDWDVCLQTLVNSIEAGEYFEALASQGVAALLGPGTCGSSFIRGGGESENKAWFNSQKDRIKAIVSNQVKLLFVVFW